MNRASPSARILLVAPDDASGRELRQALVEDGFSSVETATDARRALAAFRQVRPDVVVLDANLGGTDADDSMRQLNARIAADEFLPIVVIGRPRDASLMRRVLDAKLPAFFHDAAAGGDLGRLMRELLAIRAKGLRLAESAAKHAVEARLAEVDVARHLARTASFKDHPDSGHVERVGHLSALIAAGLGQTEEEVERIRLAAPLHDIGKVGIPDSILLKEDPLSLEEMDVIKTHTSIGAAILAGSGLDNLQLAEEIALYHHENWDGTGYTPGLERESIPLAGRIVRVADAFDAITRPRPFAVEWRDDSARDFIRSQAGHSFDPRVVEALLEALDEDVAPTLENTTGTT